jgi:hypothetical protein
VGVAGIRPTTGTDDWAVQLTDAIGLNKIVPDD